MESQELQHLKELNEEIKNLRDSSIRAEERMASVDAKLTGITESIKELHPRLSSIELRLQQHETQIKTGKFIIASVATAVIAEFFSR
jgi:chromosome segregation ATPase